MKCSCYRNGGGNETFCDFYPHIRERALKSKEKHPKIIAVDFDGTLCENKWPEIGAANWDLIYYLANEQKQGAKLILWTCRVGDRLTEAVDWCILNGIMFDAVNENLPEIIGAFGEDTRKIFANEYIDDRMSTEFELPFKKEVHYETENRI